MKGIPQPWLLEFGVFGGMLEVFGSVLKGVIGGVLDVLEVNGGEIARRMVGLEVLMDGECEGFRVGNLVGNSVGAGVGS